jgi:hypothetical protein
MYFLVEAACSDHRGYLGGFNIPAIVLDLFCETCSSWRTFCVTENVLCHHAVVVRRMHFPLFFETNNHQNGMKGWMA